MMSIPNPLVNIQRVIRQFSYGGFGVDDFMVHPQVFRPTLAHIPVTLAPNLEHPGSKRAIVHTVLKASDWHSSYANSAFGTIDESFVATMKEEVAQLDTRFERSLQDAMQAGSRDARTLQSRTSLVRTLKNMAGRLSVPGPLSECVLLWTGCQRFYHEVHAFMDWFDIYRTLYVTSPSRPCEVDTGRLGAITRSYEHAEVLFKAGLPTYFIRPAPAVDLQSDIKFLLPTSTMENMLCSRNIVATGHQIGTSSATIIIEPRPCAVKTPILFRGNADSPHHLTAMTLWAQRTHPLQRLRRDWTTADIAQLKDFGVYDPNVHYLPSEEPPTIPTCRVHPAKSQGVNTPLRTPTASQSTRTGSTSASRPDASGRNKWANRSRLMPPPLDIWLSVSELAGEGHNNCLPPTWPGAAQSKSDWRGYAFPKPGSIANMANDETRNAALCTYIEHHRPICHRAENVPDGALKVAQWRSNLLASRVSSKPGSANANTCEQAERDFNASLQESGYQGTVDFAKAPSTIQWQGAYIDSGKPLSIPHTRSILGDMNEAEFRWEAANLDWHLHNSTCFPLDGDERTRCLCRRQHFLHAITHFEGRLVPHPSFYKSNQGFASRTPSVRAKALLELARIMDEWKSDWRIDGSTLSQLHGVSLMRSDELDNVDGKMRPVVSMLERAVAAHYVHGFKVVYARAPVVPRETKLWAV